MVTDQNQVDDPSEFYAVDESERLEVDGGEGSDASDGGDDTEDLDEHRSAPGQAFETMDPDPEADS